MLTFVVGGLGVGVVVGWVLPMVRLARRQSVVASAALAGLVVGALYLLASVGGSFGGAIGIAVGAWLHALWLEHLARTVTTREA